MRTKFHQKILAMVLLGAAGLLLVGCGSDSTPTVFEEPAELSLDEPFGGYKAADQPPGFGESEILSTMTADEAAPEFAGDSVDVDTLYGNPRFTLYTITVRWGQLEGDSTVTAETDWSGMASLVRGHLKLTRIILFERGQDSIIRPRPSPLEIGWVSKTIGHFDGLSFLIADPLFPDDVLPVESSFTFSTGPFTATFDLDDLADLDTVITVDNQGNQVAITAHRLAPDPCGKGFMEGVWRANNHLNKMGKFLGKWVADDGSLTGHFRGHWGKRGNGEQVFFGQWIDLSGVFKGLLRGTWEPDPDRPGHGYLHGGIFIDGQTEIGRFRGEYILPHINESGGYFQGGWQLHCPDEGSEP
jgi:hypothetical protein